MSTAEAWSGRPSPESLTPEFEVIEGGDKVPEPSPRPRNDVLLTEIKRVQEFQNARAMRAFLELYPDATHYMGQPLPDSWRRPTNVVQLPARKTDELDDLEHSVIQDLAELDLATTINDFQEEGVQELHVWKDNKGRLGIHSKRRPEVDDDGTRYESVIYVHFDQDERIKRVHMRRVHLGREGEQLETTRARLTRMGGVGTDALKEEIRVIEQKIPRILGVSDEEALSA